MNYNPTLTEPGVKYFIGETLKNIHKERKSYNYIVFNIGLVLLFFVILSILLVYKYKTRPSEKERKEKSKLKRDYFITKVKSLQAKKSKKLNENITNLPKFESPFEKLHKNFYNN